MTHKEKLLLAFDRLVAFTKMANEESKVEKAEILIGFCSCCFDKLKPEEEEEFSIGLWLKLANGEEKTLELLEDTLMTKREFDELVDDLDDLLEAITPYVFDMQLLMES